MVKVDPLRKTIAAGLRAAKTLPARPMAQFAVEEITIPDGKSKGLRFAFSRQPVTELWFDAIDSGLFNEFIFTAPSQCGKTLSGFVIPLLYHTCEIEENYVLGLPYADMAANKWEADIKPAMKASPKLRRQMPKHGSGSGGGRVRDSITLANEAIIKLMSAGGGDTAKAAFTTRVVGVTEASRFGSIGAASEEADPMRQLNARQASYKDAEKRTYVEGTVTRSLAMPWRMKALSTDSQIVAKCPHCKEHVSPEREHLSGWQEAKSENEAARLAFFACPSCGEEITETERAAMLADAKLLHRGQSIDKKGRITGDPPDSRRLWFRMSAFHNLFREAGDVARQEWKAAQIPEESPERISAERELCQFVWCIPWDPPEMDTELEVIKEDVDKRRLHYPRRVVPPDTLVVTTGTDLGKREGWYLTLCTLWRENEIKHHIVDYDKFDVPSHRMPVGKAIIFALEELRVMLQAGYVMEDSGVRAVDEIWYDAGYSSKDVNTFVSKYAKMRIDAHEIAAYGRGQSMFDHSTYVAPKRKTNAVRQIDPGRLWFLERDVIERSLKLYWDADATKYEILQALSLPEDSSGSITLYAGTSRTHERLLRHFTAEPLINKTNSLGGTDAKFQRQGANHLLDCLAEAKRAAHRAMWRLKVGPYQQRDGESPPKASASTHPPTSRPGKWYGEEPDKVDPEPKQKRGWYEN
jgi:hypothetical protein